MNNNLFLIINIILSVCCIADLIVVLKRDLMMLQQNSYRNERYVRWFNQSNESTTPWRLGACIALFLLLVNHLPHFISAILASIILIFNCLSYLKKRYKKPLVFTPRAIRIYSLQILLALGIPTAIGICLHSIYLANEIAILLIVISPLIILLSNLLLSPVQHFINLKYYKDAESILKSNDTLKVIGITGSYGKTSTKHFLKHLLGEKFETVITPGSFNTLLGVIRTIRETLKPYTQIFIVEMGAKQPGDIKEICDLVKPKIGIITAIGEQHLETFKTQENILRTKFELIDSLPTDGLAVINDSNPIARQPKINCQDVVYYGADEHIKIKVITQHGTEFLFKDEDGTWIELTTPLVGNANIENLTAAIIVARHLKVDISTVRRAVATIPQVEHRLQVIHTTAGFTILDDAFNSNPVGAAMALDVLSKMNTSGKKIVITPGMIELGHLQYDKNKELGTKLVDAADIIIIVGEYNREALTHGINERLEVDSSIHTDNIHFVPTFNEAQKLMLSIVRKDDLVLIENDLPDTFK